MKIGFIGLGIMGEAMCANIIKKHNDTVFVYDVEKEKGVALEALGAVLCSSNKEVAEKSDLVITMVPTSDISKSIYEEIADSLADNKIAIDMSTIDPEVSIQIADRLSKKGVLFFDAPVVKSRPAAVIGELGIYVGGKESGYEKIKPILSYMGKNIIYLGKNGAGLSMKICHNALVAQIQNGVNETLLLATKSGISIEDFVKAVSYGGGQNFYLDSKANAIANENYETAFSVKNMKKDLDILKRMENIYEITLSGANITRAVYEKAVALGYEAEDFSATYKVVRKENGL